MKTTEMPQDATVRRSPEPVKAGASEPTPRCRQELSDRTSSPNAESSPVSGCRGESIGLTNHQDPQHHPSGAPATTSLPRIGEIFLGFRLVEVLGRGAFGSVYLARQGDLADRLVVLKITPRRDDEPRLLAQLQHTNIVPIYSVHTARSFQVVCMPYWGTTTLEDVGEHLSTQARLPETGFGLISSLIDNREWRSRLASPAENPQDVAGVDAGETNSHPEMLGPRPVHSDETIEYLKGLTYVQAVLWIGSRLAAGLAHAHERKILHLDLKPANVLLTDEGQPMLLDLNLSVDLKRSINMDSFGGTALYMSPEQLEAFRTKSGSVDGRSDIYSLGIILFELLTRRRPIAVQQGAAQEVFARLIASRKAPSPPLRCWNRAVSPAVESMIQHCLEPDLSRRYQHAHELQEDIERHLSHYPLKHARERSLWERIAKWRRRHPALTSTTSIAILAIMFLVVVCSASWLTLRDSSRVRASLSYLRFHESFEKAQLLLNTVHDESQDHLVRGIQLARSTMKPYLDPAGTGLASSADFASLPSAQQSALRSELAELILLEVRARMALSDRVDRPASHQEVYQWGLAQLEQARSIDSQLSSAFYHDRARLLTGLGREADAEEDRRRAAQLTPRTARDHYLLGTSLLAHHQPDRAERLLSRAVALDSRQFWTWFALGICHSDQGRHADAAADFSACTILAPEAAWPHLNRGIALSRSGRLTEALVAYDRAIELDRQLAEAWVDRGLALLELGHPHLALADLDRAIALNVRTPSILAAHAEALARVGRRDDAEKSFAEAILANPGDAAPVVARGFSRLQTNQDGAAADFTRALKLNPQSARAFLGRSYLVRPKDERAALALVTRALEIEPDCGDALQLRALIRSRMGDLGAEADIDRVLRVPTPQRLYNAACAMSLLSRTRPGPRYPSLALSYLRRALEAGLSLSSIADDPDLAPLKHLAEFRRVAAAIREAGKAGSLEHQSGRR